MEYTINSVDTLLGKYFIYHVTYKDSNFSLTFKEEPTPYAILERLAIEYSNIIPEKDMNVETLKQIKLAEFKENFDNDTQTGYVTVLGFDIAARYQDTVNMLALKSTLEKGGTDYVISVQGVPQEVDKDGVQIILDAYVEKGKMLYFKLNSLSAQVNSATTIEELENISW